jgi:glycosyltransferase involved in cell wall biosynthesis
MKVSLIISYYKNLINLKLILKALQNQSSKDFEVIISEDDNNDETIEFIKNSKFNFPLLHVNQDEDLGFRKNMTLNKSIKKSRTDFLIFIDGDCIPHKHFIKSYIGEKEEDTMLKGRRVMLSESITSKLLENPNLNLLSTKNILFSKSGKKKETIYNPYFSLISTMKNKGLLGCNWGISKQTLHKINGFDEDYVRAAVGEDTDVEWRLKGIGVTSKSVKNKAIVYHLYHERSYSKEDVNHNNKLLEIKKKIKAYYCKNGLVK